MVREDRASRSTAEMLDSRQRVSWFRWGRSSSDRQHRDQRKQMAGTVLQSTENDVGDAPTLPALLAQFPLEKDIVCVTDDVKKPLQNERPKLLFFLGRTQNHGAPPSHRLSGKTKFSMVSARPVAGSCNRAKYRQDYKYGVN